MIVDERCFLASALNGAPEREGPNLSVVIVNFNSKQLLSQTLNSLFLHAPACDMEVFVVDNASTDGSRQVVTEDFPQVKLICSESNVGFCRANNLALQRVRGEYVMLLNSDTIVKPNSIDRMLQSLESYRDVGIVGPRLENVDGTVQMSYNTVPNLLNLSLSWFQVKSLVPRFITERISRPHLCRVLGRSLSTYISWFGEEPQSHILDQDVYLTGACMLVRRQVIARVGILDPEIFMYVDDADFCKRVHDAGWSLLFLAEASIVHVKGGTAGTRYRWTSPFPYLSSLYYVKKHNGAVRFWLAKQIAVLSIFIRAICLRIQGERSADELWSVLHRILISDGSSAYPTGCP